MTHLHKSEKGIKEEISKLLSTARVSSASDLSANVLDKLKKADLISAILGLVSVFEKNVDLCKSAAEKIDELKDSNMSIQKEIIASQKSQVNSVQQTVKTELKSWSDVVKKSCNQNQAIQVAKKSVKEVMKKFNEEERRACNLMVYGVEEGAEDKHNSLGGVRVLICDLLTDMDCYSMSENAVVVDSYRIGNKEAGKTRPIRLECKSRNDARILLSNARNLKDSDEFSKVYLAPDRNREERTAHNKLVKQMKDMITADPGKYFYIRDKKICSVVKTERK